MSNNNPTNPYATSAGAYASQSRTLATDPREIEANALLNANRKFRALQANWGNHSPVELEEALRFNRQIWMMFVDTAAQNTNNHALQLRSNITNLGMFIFKHSIAVASDPENNTLDSLININDQIAAGLMTRPQNASKAEQPAAEAANAINRDA